MYSSIDDITLTGNVGNRYYRRDSGTVAMSSITVLAVDQEPAIKAKDNITVVLV